jgi:hypothetical protein
MGALHSDLIVFGLTLVSLLALTARTFRTGGKAH